jgi:hypothetical protein
MKNNLCKVIFIDSCLQCPEYNKDKDMCRQLELRNKKQTENCPLYELIDIARFISDKEVRA